jgi:hypothetical protein
MTKRNIANEILKGLDDFAAWRTGERTLRTVTMDSAVARSTKKDGSAHGTFRGKPNKGSGGGAPS